MSIEKTARMNLAEIIAYNGTDREIKDRTFMMFRQETDEIEHVSYADFYAKSLQCGHLIQRKKEEQGINSFTRFHVGVFMQNIPEFFYILGGCAFTNSTLVGINNAQVGDKLAFDINNVDMNLLFVDTAGQPGTDGSFLDTVLKAKSNNGFSKLDDSHIISIQKSGHENIPALYQQLEQYGSAIETFVPTPLDVSGAALVIFTSGTTGAPKGIEISWEKMTHVGIHATGILKYTKKDVGYVCMPVNHSNSLYLNVMPAIMNGAKIFLRRKFSVSGFIRDIRDSGATIWNCVGDPVQYLLNHFSRENRKQDYRNLPLRTVISTGTNSVNRAEFTDLFGLDIFTEVYGSTEAGALTAVDENTPPCSVGRLLKDVRIVNEDTFQECENAVLDENGAITNLGRCSGEVLVSQASLGASAFTGYYKLPQESSKKLISIQGEMFYRMGDLGAIVEQDHVRYLIFLGRTGDWIRYKGENWAPVDGIRIAGKYKGIVNMAIIGVPQSTGREDDPMYIMEIQKGDPFDIRDFYAFCRKNLPHYMLPRFIRIMKKLPMTETLKLKNSLLKKDFYYRDEELDNNRYDRIYEIQNHEIVVFQTSQYQKEIARFADPTNQDTLKAFTGNSDLFSAVQTRTGKTVFITHSGDRMSSSISISQFQKQMMAEHYQRAVESKNSGKPVVYVTATFPVEIARAFEPDIAIVYPENHAVNLIVNGMAEGLSEIAAARKAIDKMGCSYELANTGYLLETCFSEQADAGARFKSIPCLPAPDILLSCNNQCEIVAEWFQNLSDMFGKIPFKVINVGNRYDGVVDTARIQYVRKQIEDVISMLEIETNTRLDQERLLEVSRRSNQATRLWREYLDSGTRKPSPMTVFDGFFHMAAIVSERGKPVAVDYYRQLVSETKEKIAAGKSAVNHETHRLLWDNLATWFNFGELKRYLGSRNIAVVGSTYLDVWKNELDTSGYDPLLDSMAISYCSMYTNLTIEQRISLWKEMVTKYQAKGILFHNNKSCHTFSRLQGQLAEALKKEFGEDFITILFDGDMGLKERFQKHRFETAIETYF